MPENALAAKKLTRVRISDQLINDMPPKDHDIAMIFKITRSIRT